VLIDHTANDERGQEARLADTYRPLISKCTCYNAQACLQPLAKSCTWGASQMEHQRISAYTLYF